MWFWAQRIYDNPFIEILYQDWKTMMNILLTDAYSVQHVGNAALVDSTLEQLKTQFPEAQFTILAFDPTSISDFCECRTIKTLWAEPISSYSRLGKISWVARESLWAFVNILNFSVLSLMGLTVNPAKYTLSEQKLAALKAYLDADIVVSISGEALQDSLWRRIPLFLYGYWLAHNMGKVVAIFPQSIGPFEKSFTKTMVRYVLNRCNLVLPRDYPSLRTVKQLRIAPQKVHLVPDVAVNQLYVSSNKAKQLLEAEGVKLDKRPLVGMAISMWKDLDFKEYFSVMRELCHFVTENRNGTVVLFSPNMPFRQEISDWELARTLYESLPSQKNVTLLSKTYTPREFKGMQGQLDLFISTRMHATILATMIGTPTITINTQPKLRGYMNLIHQETKSCEIKDFTIEKAKELVNDTLANSDQIRLSLESAKKEIGRRAAMASELLSAVYNQKNLGKL